MSDFWSRRRAAVAEEDEQALADAQVALQTEKEAALADKSDEELLEDLGLPEPEELSDAETLRKFLTEAVPQRLKTRALRQMWRVNPVLANLDGLIEYGEDYTDAATVVENLQTTYQVGKGMMAHLEKLAEDAEAPEEVTEDEPAPEIDPAPEREEPDATETPQPVIATASEPEDADDTPARAVPVHRMQFTFEDDART